MGLRSAPGAGLCAPLRPGTPPAADAGPTTQVESAPAVIKKGLKKDEAEALLAKLTESGGKASMA